MTTRLEDVPINVKIKLAALWATIMSLYIYADYFGLFLPGHIEELIGGHVAGIPIDDVFLLVVSILMIIPSLMIFLSLTLKAQVNRWTNIILGIFNAGLTLVSGFTGDLWPFFMLYSFVEAVLCALIVWYAWNWPKQER
jgi:hypothetical protein